MAIDTFHVTIRFSLSSRPTCTSRTPISWLPVEFKAAQFLPATRSRSRLSARLAARPETRGRNTAELNISTSKELSRTLVCKGQSVVRVAADARVRLSDLPVPTSADSDTKRPRISTFHTPGADHPYMRQVNVRVERMLKAALRAGPRFIRRIWKSVSLRLLPTEHVLGV